MAETKVDIKNEYESQTWKRGDKLLASDITKMSKTVDTVENALIEINEDVIPAVAAAAKQNADTLTNIQPKIDQIDVPQDKTVSQYVDQKVADLVGAAPETLDTLQEIAEALQNNTGVIGALQSIASDNRVRVEQVENKFNTFKTEFEQHVTDAPKYTVLGDRKVIQLTNNDGLNGTTASGAGVNLVTVSSNDIVEIGSSQANLNINTAGKITINGTTNEIASKDDLNDCYNTITSETDNKLTLYASKSSLETLSNEIDAKIESATAGVAADYATKSMVEQTREVLQTNIDTKLDTSTYNTDQDILKGSVSTKASKEELNAAIETVDQKIDTKVAELQRADATASEFNAATYATIASVNADIANINDTIQTNKDSVDQSIETLNNSFTVYQAATTAEFANVRREFADADAAVAETAATNLATAVSDIEGELELKAVKSVVDQQFADMQSSVNDALALKADITYVDNGINNLTTELTNHKNTTDLQFQGITNKFETVEAKITGVQASHTQDIYDLKQFTSEKLNEHIADNNASFDVVNASITSGDQAVKAELQAALDAYKASNDAKLETLATKAEISSVYNYRGSVETYNDLPSNPQKGDVWNVGLDRRGNTGKNYAWDGFAWDDIGGVINLDQYYDKGQVHTYVSEQLVPYAKTEDLPTHLPNENALVITYNGQPLVVYTGEIAITRNIEANLNTVPVAADNLTPAKTYIDQGLAAKVDNDVYQTKVDSIDGIIVTNNQASIDRDTELETKITDLNSTLSADIESAVTESKRYADGIVADTKDTLQTDYNQQISDLTTTVVNGLSLKQDASTAFKKETADALYLAIGGKAVDSAKADYATRAESDKDGNVITTTYATKSELTTKVATDIAAAKNELNHSILANTTAISDVNAKANEASSLATAASANVATETNRAILAEQALQKNIDNEAAARNAADQDILTKLDAEAATRTSEDSKLATRIDTETTARVEANTELTNNLNTEISTRESEITRVEGLINAEASTRESSDSALTNTINLLETELKAADSQITTNLNAEINERQLENTNIRNELDSTATTIRQEFAAADATLKSELEAKLAEDLSKVFVYKGSVSTFDQLEAIVDAKIGDVYNVTNSVDGLVSEKNYAWNGTAWDDIGGIIDLSNYYTKGEVDAINAVTNGRIDTTNSQLASETTDRQNAISQVQSALDAAKSDLQSKIATTNTNLEAEQTARTTADDALGVRITAVAADLADEVTNREQGDTDAIATSKQYTDEQLAAAKLELNASIDTKVDQTEYDAFEQTTNTNASKNATDIANLSGEFASYKIANDAAVAARVLQTDFKQKVTEFTGEFASVRSEFAAANSVMHSILQSSIDNVDEALTAYKTSNDEAIDNLQTADTALQQAINDYKASNNAAVASLTETKANKTDVADSEAALQDNIDEVSNTLDQYKTSNDAVVAQLSTDKANKTDVAASEAALQNSINTLQQEVTAYKNTNNDAVAAVDAKVDANKALIDGLESSKADKATTLAGYGIADAYTKDEVDSIVTAVYRVKGSVENFDALPAVDNVVGDVYNTIDTGMNYVWTGDDTGWDPLSTIIDLSPYAKVADVNSSIADTNAKFDNYTTTADLNAALDTKADKTAVATDIGVVQTALDEYKADNDAAVAAVDEKADQNKQSIEDLDVAKADKATTVVGYGITDAYTKTEIDDQRTTINQSIETVDAKVDANKALIDGLESNKADKATTLAGYGITDAYTKQQVDNLVTAVYRLKGTVENIDALPAVDNVVGNVYNVADTGMNYVWTETGWDALGSIVDLSPYAKKTEVEAVDDKFANYTTTTDLNAALALKANAADVYNKTAIDQTVAELEGSIGTKANTADVYNKTEVDEKFADYTTTDDLNTALSLKADKSTLDNYATVTIVNAALADKANVADVYSKDEVDTKVADVDAKFADYTTTEELNTKLAEKADVTTVQSVDAKFAEYAKTADVETALEAKANVADVYNKTEVDDKLANMVTTDNSSYQNVVTNASNVVVLKSSIDQLFARIQALETPDEVVKTIVAKPGASVSQPDSDVVYSGNLTSDGTNTASTTAITAKSVQLNNVTTTDNAIAITAANNVVVDNLTTEGSIAKGSAGGRNAGMSIDSNGYVTITGGTWNSTNYNAIEIGLGGSAPKGVNIDGLTVNGKLSNNAITIFDWAENAVITVSNCHFAEVSNVVRLSNKSNVPATINFVNCTVDKWESNNKAYAGFLLMQDYTSTTAEQAISENRFHNLKITFTNCVGPNGVKLVGSGADFNNPEDQWAYIYCDKGGLVGYSEDRWPTIIGV